MAYNYVTKDGGVFDQKINQGLITSVLGNQALQFVNGGKSFTLTTISTSGFKPHTRGTGYNSGSVTNDKKVYTMGQDRDIEFFVDKEDVDETNQDLAVGNITKVFIEEQAQPEIDAYRFSTLAGLAKTSTTEKLDETNVYTRLKAALLPVRKYGVTDIIGFVSTETMDYLERSKEFTRSITNQNVGQTALESRVTSLDGVQLIEVLDPTLLNTKFDFSDGFKPQADSQAINFLFVAKSVTIPALKTQSVYLFNPGEHTKGDGYLYQNRLYHDIFVKDRKKDGVSVSIKTATAGTSTTDSATPSK
ncbi:hypothetical protein [Fructobacillus evanidus]|uniref:Phage major capsid protein n=1 Tax=Fructobacillus evanidus TaxID=3064281 RepID=A0ABN9YNN0_9LACO|nr:hypothetical protein R55250_KEHBDPNM_00181 [Fructobacillus sp. LMG 32999]CAK1222229.1 hypothetical protein R53718_MFFEMHAI_00183 [Fructobacillus sp. LMG 32999]CAK1225713.1 hypothetical protein R54837_OMAIDLJD_00112 [Fructobacillus sp. LMG 32999]CAK1225925.1 hypothetical protein R53534_HOPDCFKK_00114 [Fructobacillus sp. LMG 32999]CAK1226068.1 hypothetical protein R55214_HHFBAMCI_00123 [Fructobacillus sp. LMG 32999]